MSFDLVDDLQASEGLVADLRRVIQIVVNHYDDRTATMGIPDIPEAMAEMLRYWVAEAHKCQRLTCEWTVDGAWHCDEDCSCPATHNHKGHGQ